MPPRLDQIRIDLGLAEPLRGFQPVQPLHQDVALAVVTHLDRRLHAVIQNILRQQADRLGMQSLLARRGHIYAVNRDFLDSQHRRPAA